MFINGSRVKNLKDNTYGYLKVLEFVGVQNRLAIWKCECSKCGKEKIALRTSLISGQVRCGCLKKNLTGTPFGLLVAINVTNKIHPKKGVIWHCKCQCQNEIDVPIKDLLEGNVRSCGCMLTNDNNIIESIYEY